MDKDQDFFERMIRLNCALCLGAENWTKDWERRVSFEHHMNSGEYYHHSVGGHGGETVCESSAMRKAFPERSEYMNSHTK